MLEPQQLHHSHSNLILELVNNGVFEVLQLGEEVMVVSVILAILCASRGVVRC